METKEREEKNRTGAGMAESGMPAEITYQELEKAFLEETGSLLTKEQKEKVLKKERKKFLSAETLRIPAVRFVGKSVGRYTKGLLRHQQPFSFLYEFLGFMMEESLLVFLYLVLCRAEEAVHLSISFLSGQYVFYAAVWAGCYLGFVRVKAGMAGRFLIKFHDAFAQEAAGQKENMASEEAVGQEEHTVFQVTEKDRLRAQKKAAWLPVLPAVSFLAFGAICCFGLWKWRILSGWEPDIMTAFLIYVASALFSGLHNVLYGSFFAAYAVIGVDILFRKGKEETETAVVHYKMLCYERMLGLRGKKMEDFSRDETLAGEIMQKLRGRMAVYRGGTFFGILIFLALAIVCLVQMVLLEFHVTVALCVFTVFAVFGSLAFFLAFLSAHGVIKTL